MADSSSETSYADAKMKLYIASGGCTCPACMAALQGKADNSTTLAQVANGADGSTRGAELITQTQNADGSYSFSGDLNVDAVLIGSRWTGTSLTYSFPTAGDYAAPDSSFSTNQIPFNPQQQAAARQAFAMVAGFTNLTFTEVAPGTADVTIRLSQTQSDNVDSAQGFFPNYVQGLSGQIWFGRTDQPYYTTPSKGNWGYVTIMHEIGHTLGLKHGMDDYTNVDLGSGQGISEEVRFGSRAIEYDKDGQAWSLMTYTNAPNTPGSYEGEGQNQAQSYMQLDIAALQYLYGANYTTNAGDTVYRWDAKTGESFINGVGQGRPTGNKVFQTVWDGGGNDTYDFSDYAGGVRADLRPGNFSTMSDEQVVNNTARSGFDGTAPGSVANALLFKGNTASLVENAIGGAGDDTLIGNQVANRLTGGAGDDTLAGGLGSDTLDGGLGNDVADFTGATTGIVVRVNGAGTVAVANGDDVDTLIGIEGVVGTAYDDRLTGDGGDNMLSGGAGGRDVLVGGDGNDTLVGGGYRLAYRDEADVVRDAAGGNKSIATAVSIDGAFDFVNRAGIYTAKQYPGVVMPHASVVAEAAQVAGDDYYSFQAKAGARALFDIDYTDNYTGLEILDASGNVIASNYGTFVTDDGSRQGYDAQLAYTFQADGTYYVRVTGSSFMQEKTDLRADQPYTLNVSLEDAVTAAPVLRSAGSATMDGGAGNDMLVASAGDDLIDGGSGVDTVSYENNYRGVTVSLATTTAQETGAGVDTIAGVENLTGSAYDDRLTGDAGDNVIDGGGGSDVLAGGDGRDTLSFASQTEGVRVSLAAQGGSQSYRLGRTVSATGFEDLTGSAGADMLSGDVAANTLRGGAGNDTLMPDALGRIGGNDVLDGGDGRDTASFAPYDQAVVASLGDDGRGAAVVGAMQIDLRSIENLVGGSADDRLTGSAGNNTLAGGAGNDTLTGGAGTDWLEGGAGDDVLDGGTGTDTAAFRGATAAIVDLRTTDAQDTGYGLDRLAGIENVLTGSGNDRITGNGANNVFYDNGGDDVYNGQGGTDTVDYSSLQDDVLELDLSLTTTQDTIGGGRERFVRIENIVGGQAGNLLRGNVTGNTLTGGESADILIGSGGADTLVGGDGDDFLTGDDFGLSDAAAPAGNDTLYGGAGNDIVIGGGGNDRLYGGAGDDFLSNGTFSSAIFGTQYDRGSLIRVDGGDDIIDGGDGIDFAVLGYDGRKEGVTVDVRDASAVSVITSGGRAVGTITGVETLGFEGGDGDDIVYGGGGYDYLAGHGGNDQIYGGGGNDVIYADGGNDILDGGEGYDTVSFQDATSGVVVDLQKTGVQNTGGAGDSDLRGFENAASSTFGDTMYLTDYDNALIDDGTGDDSFYGRGGDDSFYITRSGAQASNITLDGGDGDDWLQFRAEHVVDGVRQYLDTATLTGGAGEDAFFLGTLKSMTVDAGTGDDFIAIGLAASNESGFNVTLGEGADYFYLSPDVDYASTNHTDTIVTDFKPGEDQLGLLGLINNTFGPDGNPIYNIDGYVLGDDPFKAGFFRFVQQGADTLLQVDRDGYLDSEGFNTAVTLQNVVATDITAADISIAFFDLPAPTVTNPSYSFLATELGTAGNDVMEGTAATDRLSALAGNDTLRGQGGDDILFGGDGADRLNGGTGADEMVGGMGDDTYYVDDAGDRIHEAAGQGTDTVRSSVSYTLSADVENGIASVGGLTLTGNALANRLNADAAGGTLDGAGGDDILNGAAGVDTLLGGAGNDRLYGQAGDDRLDGGAGRDRLTGGAGNDVFGFAAASEADGDLIADFATGDRIDLSAIDANAGVGGKQSFAWIGENGFSGVAGELGFLRTGDNAFSIVADLNGDKVADFGVAVRSDHLLVQTDFML